jgi:hypothetical protein
MCCPIERRFCLSMSSLRLSPVSLRLERGISLAMNGFLQVIFRVDQLCPVY